MGNRNVRAYTCILSLHACWINRTVTTDTMCSYRNMLMHSRHIKLQVVSICNIPPDPDIFVKSFESLSGQLSWLSKLITCRPTCNSAFYYTCISNANLTCLSNSVLYLNTLSTISFIIILRGSYFSRGSINKIVDSIRVNCYNYHNKWGINSTCLVR